MFLGTLATALAPECEKNTGAIETSIASEAVSSDENFGLRIVQLGRKVIYCSIATFHYGFRLGHT